MFIRVVNITCKKGMEEKLRKVGREVLVPVNKKAGCHDVYFLEPCIDDNNPNFGVVSIWEKRETLLNMRASKEYKDLLHLLGPLIEENTDTLFTAYS